MRWKDLAILSLLALLASGSWAQSGDPEAAVEGQPFFWALSVSDVERSVEWYERVLGFVETRAIDMPERSVRIRLMRTDRAFLELVEHDAARDLSELDPSLTKRYLALGTFKVGLLVEDLDSTVARLGELDVPLRGTVFEEPDGSFRSTQIEDPDGNVLQLFERLGNAASAEGAARLNAEGVLRLLDVLDALVVEHPDFEERSAELAAMGEEEREATFDAARTRNEASPEIQAAIDALLSTPTYEIYFRRFTNVTADEVRDLLLDLPYRKRRAPGDLGVTFYELIRRRNEVRAGLERLLKEADVGWVNETAERFAPGWDGAAPTMHLIYDSNAGSFATEGVPFFNVYTGIDLVELGRRADAAALREAEETMAHELQHALAEPMLYPEDDRELPWNEVWLDQLTRGLVGEGVANLCSPPVGRIQEVYEDPEVLAALVEQYNELLRSLLKGEGSEEEVQAWYRDNYFDTAIGLLRQHLAKTYSGGELEEQVQASMRYRPDVEHALGWWMISRVWERDERSATVVRLLSEPFSVYELYNATLDEHQRELQIDPEVARVLSER